MNKNMVSKILVEMSATITFIYFISKFKDTYKTRTLNAVTSKLMYNKEKTSKICEITFPI